MKCSKCRGACCETFAVQVGQLEAPDVDSLLWILLHGVRREVISESKWDDLVQFECKCLELDENGGCSIYNDPRRPKMCSDMVIGGTRCLIAVAERRTPEQYKEIRDDDDPVDLKAIHDRAVEINAAKSG